MNFAGIVKTKIIFNFLPEVDVENLIQKEKTSKKSLANILSEYLPKSLVKVLLKEKDYNLSQIKKSEKWINKTLKDENVSLEDIHKLIGSEIKKYNKLMPTYKYVKDFELRDTEFEKTTTRKIKRFLVK